MSIKLRLVVMNFLQFFVWGSWLITIGAYWFQNKHWGGAQFGAIFSTMGIASLFMPSLMGVVADKWINAEKLYGLLHILGAVMLCIVPMIDRPNVLLTALKQAATLTRLEPASRRNPPISITSPFGAAAA